MNKKLMIIATTSSIVLVAISLLVFSSSVSNRDLFDRSSNMEAVKVFLTKYPTAKNIVEAGDINLIRYVFENVSKNSGLSSYVYIEVIEDSTTEQITLECWDGKERHIVIGSENIIRYLQQNSCL